MSNNLEKYKQCKPQLYGSRQLTKIEINDAISFLEDSLSASLSNKKSTNTLFGGKVHPLMP